MFRLIKEIKPEFVIGENVQGIINLQDGMVLRQVQDQLEGEGFEVQCFLIPAWASVLGTKETESGLWATPNTMDYLPPRSAEGTKKLMEGHRKGRKKPSNLREQVDPITMSMYPTPSASCQMDVVAPPETVEKNSSGGWSVRREGTGRKLRSETERCSEQVMADTESKGSQGCRISTDMETESGTESSKNSSKKQYTWWEIERDLCGVPNGISYELDKTRSLRIKSLGNAIVPQIARILGLAIKKVLSDSDCNGSRG